MSPLSPCFPCPDDSDDGSRRLKPRIWRDHDWYVLRRMRLALEELLDRCKSMSVSNLEPKKMLDFGCGHRPYETLVRVRGWEYIACDLTGRVDVLAIPQQALELLDNSIALVGSFQVLEHVWDLDWYFGEVYRVLQPDGAFLLSTHGTWLYHPHPTDYRRWTREGLLGELRARGFHVLACRSIVGPLAWTSMFRLFAVRYLMRKVPILGPMVLVPVLLMYNLRMLVEDWITPRRVREVNGCVYLVMARKDGSGG